MFHLGTQLLNLLVQLGDATGGAAGQHLMLLTLLDQSAALDPKPLILLDVLSALVLKLLVLLDDLADLRSEQLVLLDELAALRPQQLILLQDLAVLRPNPIRLLLSFTKLLADLMHIAHLALKIALSAGPSAGLALEQGFGELVRPLLLLRRFGHGTESVFRPKRTIDGARNVGPAQTRCRLAIVGTTAAGLMRCRVLLKGRKEPRWEKRDPLSGHD